MPRTAAIVGKPPARGMVERDNQPPFGYDTPQIMPLVVCEVLWADLQPNSTNDALQGKTTQVGTLTSALVQGQWTGAKLNTTALPLIQQQSVIQIGSGGPTASHLVQVSNYNRAGATTLPIYGTLANNNFPVGTPLYLLQGTDAIDAYLRWANAVTGRGVVLRPRAGRYAPNWVLNLADASNPTLTDGVTPATPLTIMDVNGVGTGALCANFTTPAYRSAYNQLNQLLAAKYDGNPGLAEVDAGGGAGSLFPEPMLTHIVDTTKPNNIFLPTAVAYVLAKITGPLITAAIQYFMDDASAAWKTTPIYYAFNPYQNLTKSMLPQLITASTTTSITVANSIGNAHDWQTTGNNYFSAMVLRFVGKWTVDPSGLTVVPVPASAGVVVGDNIFSDGAQYLVDGVSAPSGGLVNVTLHTAHDSSGNDSNMMYYVQPALVPAGLGFAITDNPDSFNFTIPATGQGANAMVGLYVIPVGMLFQTAPGGDQVSTRTVFLPHWKTLPRTVTGNDSGRKTSNFTVSAPWADMYNFAGPPAGFAAWFAEQTASDANINGSDVVGTDNPLISTLGQLLASPVAPTRVELPNNFKGIWSGVTKAGTANLIEDDTVTNPPPSSITSFASGGGSYAVCQLYDATGTIPGRSYLISAVSSVGLMTVFPAGSNIDTGAGLHYTLYAFDYLSPAQCAMFTAMCRGVSSSPRRLGNSRTAATSRVLATRVAAT